MIVYATTADLSTWDPTLSQPANLDQLLRSASIIIARAVNESLHNPATVITDPKRDATCAQATAWIRSGIDPSASVISLAGKVKSKGVDTATVTYDVATPAEREAALANLAAEAASILYSAGLLWAPVPVWSATPDQGLFVNEFGTVGGKTGFSGYGYRYGGF